MDMVRVRVGSCLVCYGWYSITHNWGWSLNYTPFLWHRFPICMLDMRWFLKKLAKRLWNAFLEWSLVVDSKSLRPSTQYTFITPTKLWSKYRKCHWYSSMVFSFKYFQSIFLASKSLANNLGTWIFGQMPHDQCFHHSLNKWRQWLSRVIERGKVLDFSLLC